MDQPVTGSVFRIFTKTVCFLFMLDIRKYVIILRNESDQGECVCIKAKRIPAVETDIIFKINQAVTIAAGI
jgi:hypothetical protein